MPGKTNNNYKQLPDGRKEWTEDDDLLIEAWNDRPPGESAAAFSRRVFPQFNRSPLAIRARLYLLKTEGLIDD